MYESLTSGLHLLLATLALFATPDLVAVGALGVTFAVVSAAIVVVALLALAIPEASLASHAHPTRAIDLSSSLTQSDPDASGHPRPRAPAAAASAA